MSPKIILLGVASLKDVAANLACLKKYRLCGHAYEQKKYHSLLSTLDQAITTRGDDFINTGIAFAFNEYWVSKLHEKALSGFGTHIADRAIMAARSKLYLSELLKSRGIAHVERKLVTENGILPADSIIRPDCAYSGRGVKHIRERMQCSDISSAVAAECSAEMNYVLRNTSMSLICEPFLSGEEYSCDVIISPTRCQIIRLCLKKIAWIDSHPCTIAYLTIHPSEEISATVCCWCNALFSAQDYSFAQFDFIRHNKDGKYYPIDFSPRIGGGLAELVSRAATPCFYCEAIAYAMGKKEKMLPIEANWAQYNILPNVNQSALHNFDGVLNIGDIIKKNNNSRPISSANARLAEIVRFEKSFESFEAKCQMLIKAQD